MPFCIRDQIRSVLREMFLVVRWHRKRDGSGDEVVGGADRDRRSAALARLLARKGVGAESAVALLVDHGVHAVVSMVAVVRAGGVYVPLNKSFPIDRVRSMIAPLPASLS